LRLLFARLIACRGALQRGAPAL